jgi:hypothetical protein
MTHDELLEELNEIIKDFDQKYDNSNPYYKALRAVVELHKPLTTPNNFTHCPECQYGSAAGSYPCKTIQAITKELA